MRSTACLVLTATVSVLLAGMPGVAHSAPGAVAKVVQNAPAVAAAGATVEEKAKAAAVLGLVPSSDLLVLSDKNFVVALWRKAVERPDQLPELRASAELAFAGSDFECTQWIKTGIHEAYARDVARQKRDADTARAARDLKLRAAASIQWTPSNEESIANYKDFTFMLWERQTGPKMKAAARAAFDGSEAAQKDFLANGIFVTVAQDKQDKIDADDQATAEEKARQAARNAKAKAMAQVIGFIAPAGMLELSDDNFVREIMNRAVLDSEVAVAAGRAYRSTSPVDWKLFIDKGIYEANVRDKDNFNRKVVEANRRRALEIQAKAQSSRMHPNQVAAAKAALAGTDDDVDNFLRIGQYESAVQSLSNIYRREFLSVGLPSRSALATRGQFTGDLAAVVSEASWTIIPGLASSECHSMEWSGHPGYYLHVNEDHHAEAAPSDASDKFRRDATWCVRSSRLDSRYISLESLGFPGRFLRKSGGGVYAAIKGTVGCIPAGQGDPWPAARSNLTPTASEEPCSDSYAGFDGDTSWLADVPQPKVVSDIMYRWLYDSRMKPQIGSPVGDEQVDGSVHYQEFDSGRLYWAKGSQVREMDGFILEAYLALGGHAFQALGVPITDESGTPDDRGRFNHFANGGSIYWTPETWAHVVYGPIRTKWASMGWETSWLGYPTSDEFDIPGGRRSEFEGGHIDWDPVAKKATAYRN
ncbi:AbfB domain-containing protein [Amycolatopsis sp. NPDC059657]|uniref:AbfB domain-containing protein n=1 Tax=Amycolatopsis sp. NPDC059657 TaxID=3346899 RepID=UPI00366FC16B